MNDAAVATGPTATGLSDAVPRSGPTRPAGMSAWMAALMAASGFAGLGEQIVWTQQGAAWLGHESAAVLAVVTAFFGGLAAGAIVLGPPIARSARPVRWYVACEVAIGAWTLVLVGAMAPIGGLLVALGGPAPAPLVQWAIAFVGTTAMLLPATVAMGATLPAFVRVARHATSGAAREAGPVAALYAANTAGAVAGVVATASWLVPSFGLARSALVCAAVNLACATGAAVAFGRRSIADPVAAAAATAAPPSRASLVPLAATGLLGIGFEVVVVRVISQVTEDTVFTFAALLAVYLAGTAAGAAAYARWRAARPATTARTTARTTDLLLCALAAACLAGGASLWGASNLAAWIASRSATMAGAIGGETLLAALAFAAPTIAMGALFAHLATSAEERGVGLGRAIGANIVGATAAPLVFGVVVAPAFGAKATLAAIVAGYLALLSRAAWASPLSWLPAIALAAVVAAAPPLVVVDVPEGGRVVSYREGIAAAVSVVEDRDGVSRLRINDRAQEGSSATRFVDSRQALLPLLLHPAPRHALFLGLGTGVTAASAAEDPTLEVDAVELLPEVIDASTFFVGEATANPRLHRIAADARRFVRTAGRRYDVVVADNFHPARSGSGALYTIEHFAAVRDRLADDGLFCQWLPLHQLDFATLRSIVRTFVAVYPDAVAILASNSLATPVVGLVGRRDGRRLRVDAIGDRIAHAAFPDGLATTGLDDALAVTGSVVAGPGALARFAADAPLNTDDRPVVAHLAPRETYAPRSSPADRLVALLGAFPADVADVLDATTPPSTAAAVTAYWTARNRFVVAGRDVRATNDVRAMLAQVEAPLLDALRTSADFRPAYDPLLRMAVALADDDLAGARALLAQLAQVAPARPEAAAALARLGPR